MRPWSAWLVAGALLAGCAAREPSAPAAISMEASPAFDAANQTATDAAANWTPPAPVAVHATDVVAFDVGPGVWILVLDLLEATDTYSYSAQREGGDLGEGWWLLPRSFRDAAPDACGPLTGPGVTRGGWGNGAGTGFDRPPGLYEIWTGSSVAGHIEFSFNSPGIGESPPPPIAATATQTGGRVVTFTVQDWSVGASAGSFESAVPPVEALTIGEFRMQTNSQLAVGERSTETRVEHANGTACFEASSTDIGAGSGQGVSMRGIMAAASGYVWKGSYSYQVGVAGTPTASASFLELGVTAG